MWQADTANRWQQRLLANLPFFPEARHDPCQRRILLRNISMLDMAPCAAFYALKINKFLFWTAADLDQSAASAQGHELIADLIDAPDSMTCAGVLEPKRVMALEWEESVKMSWLQEERMNEASDASAMSLGARGLSNLFSTLAAVMTEAPLYVKTLLCRHICAVLKVIVHRAAHKNEIELIDTSEIPEDLKITEEVLFRAVTLLEIAGDLRCLVTFCFMRLEREIGGQGGVEACVTLRRT